ncbi:MAG TPA: efflux RND transporter periplasmic adaptor subunit [Daejeonella sp.]
MKSYITLVSGLILMTLGCKQQKNEDMSTGHDHATSPTSEVVSDTLHLDDYAARMANIQTHSPRVTGLNQDNFLPGTAVTDDDQKTVITSRVQGRVEKLYLKNTGATIRKGEALYQIYSEALLSDINGFLATLELAELEGDKSSWYRAVADAGRRKLLLQGITSSQLAKIERTRKVDPYITFYSPVSGVVHELGVTEGQYIAEGYQIAKVAALNTIWIETQVYVNEVNKLAGIRKVTVSFEAFPNKHYPATLVFDNPALEDNTKINLVRFKMDNAGLNIKPGMQATVHLKKQYGSGVTVPKTALIVGNLKYVWVKIAPNVYQRRMVNTGPEGQYEISILSGINAGDQVVVTGGYLLSSELALRQGGASHSMDDM